VTFRHRITLVATAAVAVAVLVASALTYVLVSNQLHGQIDSSLRDTAQAVQRTTVTLRANRALAATTLPHGVAAEAVRRILALSGHPSAPDNERLGRLLHASNSLPGQERGVFQLLGVGGKVLVGPDEGLGPLPVSAHARALAGGRGTSYMSEAHIGSDHLRIFSAALPAGTPAREIQIARSLNDVDHTLSNLRLTLLLVALGGVAVAALLGALVSRAAVAPVRQLTEAAEHIAKTHDLTRRIQARGGGELQRLAVSFNAMLDALEQSMRALDASARAQRQLVADTSHELRTPVTSVRANIEVLQQSPELSDVERERLLADVVEQLEDLTALIGDVIELARGDEPSPVLEEVRLDELVAETIERVRPHAPQARIEQRLSATVVLGDPARLDRAVKNLLDNALKFGPAGGPVEVSLGGGELTVRDHGPGIDPADLEHAFDRFYRGAGARALPGSGLGLAIVRQVAEAHGGSVQAEVAPGGGLIVRLRLPTLLARQHERLRSAR
jgi:two-component system sensor histidine kinase MprB